MAELDTSIYKPAPKQENPVDLLNKIQQFKLNQQAETIRQFGVDQAQADDLRSTMGSLANTPGITGAEVAAAAAARARQMRISPHIVHEAIAPLLNGGLQGKDLMKHLGVLGAGATGPSVLTQGQEVIEPTGATNRVPAPATWAKTVPTKLSPEQAAAATTTGTLGAASYDNARTLSSNLEQQTYGLKQAIQSIGRLKASDVGPIGEHLNGIKSLAVSAGLDKLFGIDVSKVTDYQTAQKYLNDWARNSGAASNSVAQLEAAQSANPNMTREQNALLKVSRSALALARMKAMQHREFEAAREADPTNPKLARERFVNWVAENWSTKHDPHVYLMDQLPIPDRQKYIKSLSPAKERQFMIDYDKALKNGIVGD